jgi:hypothetical protein
METDNVSNIYPFSKRYAMVDDKKRRRRISEEFRTSMMPAMLD